MRISAFVQVSVITIGLILANVGFAQSQLSQGCSGINNPQFDGQYADTNPGPWAFNAGDSLQMTASPPDSTGQVNVELFVNGNLVDSVPFPGTVAYTFTTDMTVDVKWITFNNATWVVDCFADSPPPPSAPLSSSPVPTLGQLGMAVLAILLAGFAFYHLRRTLV